MEEMIINEITTRNGHWTLSCLLREFPRRACDLRNWNRRDFSRIVYSKNNRIVHEFLRSRINRSASIDVARRCFSTLRCGRDWQIISSSINLSSGEPFINRSINSSIVDISHPQLEIRYLQEFNNELCSLPSSNASDRQNIPVSMNSRVSSQRLTSLKSMIDCLRLYRVIFSFALSPMNG